MMHFLDQWLLSILLCLPAAGAGAVLILHRRHAAARWTALGVCVAALVIALSILARFDWHRQGDYAYGPDGTVQMRCRAGHYQIAIDGLSFPLVVLTGAIALVCCAAPWHSRQPPPGYLALMLLLETAGFGTFIAFDLLLFWAFLLLGSILSCILTGMYGGSERLGVAGRLGFYQAVALGCLLIMVIGVWSASREVFAGGTGDLVALASPQMQRTLQTLPHSSALFAFTMIAFLILMAMVPAHGWFIRLLSDAPAPVSMHVGTLLPVSGGYGLLRIAYPLFPDLSQTTWMIFATLAVVTILYAAACAISQGNLNQLIAYASISMTGFVLLGIAMKTTGGSNGAVFLLIAQALCLGLLLMLAGVFADRMGNADLDRVGASAAMPLYGGIFVVACLAYLVVPGLLGQALVILGSFRAAQADSVLIAAGVAKPAQIYAISVAGSLGVVVTGACVLRMMRGVLFVPTSPSPATGPDLKPREVWVLAPLAALVISFGVLPGPLCFAFTQGAIGAILPLRHAAPATSTAIPVTRAPARIGAVPIDSSRRTPHQEQG